MRKPRGENELWGLAFFAVLGLLCYGGYALYRDHVAKPDDSCYWLVRDDSAAMWLIDAQPDGSCAHLDFAQKHLVKSAPSVDELATVTQKAGRRICGQVVPFCEGQKR